MKGFYAIDALAIPDFRMLKMFLLDNVPLNSVRDRDYDYVDTYFHEYLRMFHVFTMRSTCSVTRATWAP